MRDPFIRPDVKAFLDSGAADRMPPLNDQIIAMLRQMAMPAGNPMDADAGEIAVKRDLSFAGPAGAVPVRLYDARADRGPGPVLVYYHGGGFVVGSIELFDALAAEMARALDLPVVSVEYRLAPENPFPAAPDDAEAAARWVAGSPAELGREATALVLAGDSAGGNLAIVTALALRDKPAAVPVLALLALYPALGRQREYPSFQQFGDGYLLKSSDMDYYDRAYAADAADWRGRPSDASFEGFPPSVVVTASLDPLRDEGRAFAGKLAAAGVPVTFREAHGTIHGFATMRKVTPSAAGDVAAALAALATVIAEASAK